MATEIMKTALAAGENIVLPKIGGYTRQIVDIVKQAKDASYNVSVHYVDLAWNKSLSRMLSRFQQTKRLLPLDAIFTNFDMPVEKGIEERAHLEIKAVVNDDPEGQRNRLQQSLDQTGWTIAHDNRKGSLDLTWKSKLMNLDFALNKAKSMNLGWAKTTPKEVLKDRVWQMLLPERLLATSCKEANICTVSLTVDDSQCYKIRKTFEYLKSEVLSLEHGDSFARWDTDTGEDEHAILKEHEGAAIDLYSNEGRLLKAEELQTGEHNHVRNQYSKQKDAPRDGPGGNGEGGLDQTVIMSNLREELKLRWEYINPNQKQNFNLARQATLEMYSLVMSPEKPTPLLDQLTDLKLIGESLKILPQEALQDFQKTYGPNAGL